MTHLPIPIAVLYAGLVGTLLALIVATAQQRWSPKVFFLLALRLAIGWQFLFEGLYKVNTHLTGPTDANPRTFSSEPFFRTAPGPIGEHMRRQFENPEEVIAAKAKRSEAFTPEAFGKLSIDQQAAACPTAVAQALADMQEKAEAAVKDEAKKEIERADADEAKAVNDPKATDTDKAWAKATAEAVRQAARKKEAEAKPIAGDRITAAKAAFARWVYGVDGRTTKVKFVTGDVAMTAPQRLEHLDWLRGQMKATEGEQSAGLGNGTGTAMKRIAEMRNDLVAAESDLANDATAFVSDLKKELNGGKDGEEDRPLSMGQRMDLVTMWFLVAVGACLMAGLFTRLSCVLAAGFLVMTYLAHPPFPWYPLPPNTEGNPLFINKNAIECLALLALACMPTGRWLGLDALIAAVCGCGRRCEAGERGA